MTTKEFIENDIRDNLVGYELVNTGALIQESDCDVLVARVMCVLNNYTIDSLIEMKNEGKPTKRESITLDTFLTLHESQFKYWTEALSDSPKSLYSQLEKEFGYVTGFCEAMQWEDERIDIFIKSITDKIEKLNSIIQNKR